jgi:hypothetical protein
MRTLRIRILALFVVLCPLVGCGLSDEKSESPAPNDSVSEVVGPREAIEPPGDIIVFRGRYFQDKFCKEGPKGEFALGRHHVVEVAEVLRGELKLKRLIDASLPDDLKEGKYTFRWRRSAADRKEVRAAEQKGFTGMWIDAKLELVDP